MNQAVFPRGLAVLAAAFTAASLPLPAASREAAEPLEPPAMIALADADPRRGHSGTYRIAVKATGKPGVVTFLNSDADYRAAGNVTFAVAPAVAADLTKRFGCRPVDCMTGRTVVVTGVLTRHAIVNTLNDRPQSFNRWAYEVRVERTAQIVSITP